MPCASSAPDAASGANRLHHVGVAGRPFERLEAADRAANCDQFGHAESLNESALCGDDIADRDQRKTHCPGVPVSGLIDDGPVVP